MVFVKKNETQSIGSTIVQTVIILHIQNVFLAKTQISSNTYNDYLLGGFYTFVYHPHTFNSIVEIKGHPQCNRCNS